MKDEIEGAGRFSAMFERAAAVLRRNDMGGWTRAAAGLYPHQWSWDSAFIAIGLAHLDVQRAGHELSTLFANQWANGKVPHIVFNPNAPPGSYLLGPEHWMPATLEKLDPSSPRRVTSALCQPAVHAVAALKIWEAAEVAGEAATDTARAILTNLYPKLYAWHRYLMSKRDPEGSGLVTIYHPWESGTDNSPRWDKALLAVEVGEMLPYQRPDLRFVDEPSERPTKEEYDRYLWLVELLKRSFYDEAEIYRSHPFLVKDVLFSAILVCANEALLKIAGLIGVPDEDRTRIEDWAARGRQGLKECWDPDLGLCLDYDLRAGRALCVRTVAGFAPLLAGAYEPWQLDALLKVLYSLDFLGYAGLRWPLPPSTSPREVRFHPRAYWRGPIWPIISWLFWRSLRGAGEKERAAELRSAALEQLAAGGFAEYFEPLTGEPLGSDDQSWTAAVALDWLAEGDW